MQVVIRYNLQGVYTTQKKTEHCSIYDGPVLQRQRPDGSGHIDSVSVQKWSDLHQAHYEYHLITVGEEAYYDKGKRWVTVDRIVDVKIS